MLVADFEELDDELKKIDTEIIEEVEEEMLVDDDKAAYAIPSSDEGYHRILKERFGHDTFKEG